MMTDRTTTKRGGPVGDRLRIRGLEHDPEKACPGPDPGWVPVFGKRSCSTKKLERDDDSKRSYPALGSDLIGFRGNPGLERAHTAARHRHRIAILRGELDQPAVSGSLEADYAIEVDDVAAVHAHEAGGVETRFDVTDCQRTEQLRRSGEDISVMGVGVDGDDIVDRDELRHALALDWKPAGDTRGWRADAPERRIGSLFQIIVDGGVCGDGDIGREGLFPRDDARRPLISMLARRDCRSPAIRHQ